MENKITHNQSVPCSIHCTIIHFEHRSNQLWTNIYFC